LENPMNENLMTRRAALRRLHPSLRGDVQDWA